MNAAYGLGVVDLKGDHPHLPSTRLLSAILRRRRSPSEFRNVARLRCFDVYLDTRAMDGEPKSTEVQSGTVIYTHAIYLGSSACA